MKDGEGRNRSPFEEATRGERERAPSVKVPIWEYEHE